jgi:hypothetical protein
VGSGHGQRSASGVASSGRDAGAEEMERCSGPALGDRGRRASVGGRQALSAGGGRVSRRCKRREELIGGLWAAGRRFVSPGMQPSLAPSCAFPLPWCRRRLVRPGCARVASAMSACCRGALVPRLNRFWLRELQVQAARARRRPRPLAPSSRHTPRPGVRCPLASRQVFAPGGLYCTIGGWAPQGSEPGACVPAPAPAPLPPRLHISPAAPRNPALPPAARPLPRCLAIPGALWAMAVLGDRVGGPTRQPWCLACGPPASPSPPRTPPRLPQTGSPAPRLCLAPARASVRLALTPGLWPVTGEGSSLAAVVPCMRPAGVPLPAAHPSSSAANRLPRPSAVPGPRPRVGAVGSHPWAVARDWRGFQLGSCCALHAARRRPPPRRAPLLVCRKQAGLAAPGVAPSTAPPPPAVAAVAHPASLPAPGVHRPPPDPPRRRPRDPTRPQLVSRPRWTGPASTCCLLPPHHPSPRRRSRAASGQASP